MDFALSLEHEHAVARARQFATDILAPRARERANNAQFDPDLWRHASALGLTGLPVEAEQGGWGCDMLGTALVIEALAAECEDLGILFAICAHNFGCAVPLWRAGTKECSDKWLRRLACGGAVGAAAITESEAGSDVFALVTSASETSDGFALAGHKRYVTNAPIADLIIVYARTEPVQGPFGISAFAVPAGVPGLRVEPAPRKSGLASAPWGSVFLDDCRVPSTALVGERGAGAAIFNEAMRWERTCLLALTLGATKRMLARCIDHVRSRRQFGQPIGQFQAVANKLVDMRLRLEASQWLLYHAAWLHSRNEPADEAICLSKIMSAESAVAAGIDAVQLFGGEGIMPDCGIELFLRDMLPLRILAGTTEVQKQLLARFMGITR
ncbi:MAG TPA: acyl-CoA dehydrogenase family protein [Xanthobacteraceae bacterium]